MKRVKKDLDDKDGAFAAACFHPCDSTLSKGHRKDKLLQHTHSPVILQHTIVLNILSHRVYSSCVV